MSQRYGYNVGFTPGSYTAFSEWELRELLDRLDVAMKLPRGHRGQRMRGLASEYGVCVRTLYRWHGKRIESVRVGPFSALFAWRKGQRPYQITGWERAA